MKSMESSAAISGDSLIIKEKTTENLGMRAQDDMPTMREKICYGFGDVSCNIVYGLVASLITLFYTDYVGVPAMTVGLVMIISRCLDGDSDFVMGIIVSKTNSKWGKARPWILWMAVPFGVAAVLLMMVPQTTPMLQFWYILVTYNLVTTVLYTAVNLPYGTMSAMMTRSSRGRDLLGIFRMAMSPFGRIIAVTFTLPLVKVFGSDQMAWVKTMSIWAVIAVILLLLCFKNCEERVHIEAAEKSNIGLGKNLKALFTNKYFWAVTILWMVQSSYNAVFGTTAPYFCKYILGNDELYSVMYTIEMVVIISGVLFSQVLLRRFGKRDLALAGSILVVVAQCILMTNPNSVAMAMGVTVLRAIGTVPLNACVFGMICDVIEYGQWKTHVRQESLIMSGSSVGTKFGQGVAGGIIGMLLTASGYISSTGKAVVQPESALHMIQNMFIYGPIILWGAAVIVLLFYKLDKHYGTIMADLKEREQRGEL